VTADNSAFLGIETSGEHTGLALTGGGSAPARLVEYTKAQHNERIFELLERLFEKSSLTVEQLSGIGVVTGPGMFTSLRVGLAVAKGIAISRAIPTKGLNTLDAMVLTALRNRQSVVPGSQPAVRTPQSFLPVIDAHKGEVYCALYQEATRRSDYSVLSPAGLAPLTDSEVTVCCAPGLPYRALIEDALGRRASFLEIAAPSPELVAEYARNEILAGRADDPAGLSPFYLRRTDAELRRDAAAVR
jgi:tRNA threonylcarbamoyladenosine biosynthesis protein TsaB